MTKFKKLTFQNLMSYGNVPTEFVFKEGGTALISGRDLDNHSAGIDSNGVGKSTIINALVICLYDKPLLNVPKDKLINNINKKNMRLTVEFEKNGKNYEVYRGRKTPETTVRILEEGHDITPDSISSSNDLIAKIVGIPYELFIHIVTFSATNMSFFNLPLRSTSGKSQTDIIEELFNLTILTQRADSLKAWIKETDTIINSKASEIYMMQEEKKRYEQHIISIKEKSRNWEEQKNTQYDSLKNGLNYIDSGDIEEQERLLNIQEDFKEERKKTLERISTIEDEIKLLITDIEKIDNELKQLDHHTCPYCKQDYQASNDMLTNIHNKQDTLGSNLERSLKYLDDTKEVLKKIDSGMKDNQKSLKFNSLKDITTLKTNETHYKNRLNEIENTENPFLSMIEELKQTKLPQMPLDEMSKLQEFLDHQKFLLKLLTKKDSFVRKSLLDQSIPFLNRRLAEYLQELGLQHTVKFTHEMTAQISYFDRELDYGNLSSGQKARVNIALSFSFRDVLQSLHDSVNICLLDEALDVGLDSSGVAAAAKLLKRKAREEGTSIYIITHKEELAGIFDEIITVEMKNGFSSIVKKDLQN
jgi:DNA repair exonuclease SbcCD ATPase subunit